MNRSFLLSVCALFLVFGCDEDSGHPTLDTGLPPGEPIGDLSAEESAQVCEAAETLVNELSLPAQAQIHCTLVGIVIELAGEGECAAARDNCLSDGVETVPVDLACDSAPATSFEGCEATIGQLEACVNDVSAAVDVVLDSIDCTLMDDPNATTELEAELQAAADPATHPACGELSEACLAFLELPAVGMDAAAP